MSIDVDIRARVGAFELAIALSAEPGEVLAVLGPNGSGKSTLLDVIAGHRAPHRGRVLLGGLDITTRPPEKRRVGLLGQRAMLFPHLTAAENVAFGPRAQGRSRSEARARATTWLSEVGMAEFSDRRPAQLSGGQQQRVALARALAAEPDALLLDEPFAGLDAQTAMQARRLIAVQRDRVGVPMILVTHDAVDAVAVADRTVVLQNGVVVQQGATPEVLGHPRSQFVADVAGVNLLEGVIGDDGALRTGETASISWRAAGDAPRAGTRASVVFAPGAVRVRTGADSTSGSASPNTWRGHIEAMEPVPGGIRMFTSEHPEIAVICASGVAASLGIRTGTFVQFSVDDEDLSLRSAG